MTPRRWSETRQSEAIEGNDRLHREAMRQGSKALRDRILDTLANRQMAFQAQTRRHDAARKAIAKGIDREQVMSLFDLSETAYEQLAGQVRAGAA